MLATQKFASRVVASVLAGKNLNEALNLVWREDPSLLPRQKGAIQDVSYGTLRQLGLIESILKQLLQKPLHEPELKALILVAIYQLQFSRSAPHAIVDHAVTVAMQTGAGHGKGLVNGVGKLAAFAMKTADCCRTLIYACLQTLRRLMNGYWNRVTFSTYRPDSRTTVLLWVMIV